ncbi:MAG: hypothetical protein K1X39_03010 [Thermoflexales bacterium]|nr:hypothetical protein [Thermoflexales bacterium]
MKRLLERFHGRSHRQAVALLVISLLVSLGLAVGNLLANARATQLHSEMERLYQSEKDLISETNELYTQIGKVASTEEMERRARQAGFVPTDKFEYLQMPTPTARPTVTATLTTRQP